MQSEQSKPVIALYASPKCRDEPNLRRYKSYFNVAWFVRAYTQVLRDYRVVTTDETLEAVKKAHATEETQFAEHWAVPGEHVDLSPIGAGFDAQVRLAAMVAQREVDTLLMFQDPDDVLEHLPEANALIRNCTLANVSLHINAGATFWAETRWIELKTVNLEGFGKWRQQTEALHEILNPSVQRIAFIAHESEKPKMSRVIYHYRKQFRSPGYDLTGTSGTCKHALNHLAEKDTPYWEIPDLRAAAAFPGAGHGPTGGDVVIASDIIKQWHESVAGEHDTKPALRNSKLSHTVVFFIDHEHAQPHQADIHVLLRTCLHPNHGVHLLLNERSAVEWAQTLRDGTLSPNRQEGIA